MSICTTRYEDSKFLDAVDFGVMAFSMETVILDAIVNDAWI